jgi:hypothetical protein
MKTPAEVLLFVGVLFVQGCTYVPSVEPTDLSAVYEETATRSEIEAVLGEPVASRVTDDDSISISIYPYNKGAGGELYEPLGDLSGHGVCREVVCLPAFLLVQTLVWASTPLLYENKKDEQKGFLAVVYSADDPPTIMRLPGNVDPDALMDGVVANLQRKAQLMRRAEEGGTEWLSTFPMYTDLAVCDMAVWTAWIESPSNLEFLDNDIKECQRIADGAARARGLPVFHSRRDPVGVRPD